MRDVGVIGQVAQPLDQCGQLRCVGRRCGILANPGVTEGRRQFIDGGQFDRTRRTSLTMRQMRFVKLGLLGRQETGQQLG